MSRRPCTRQAEVSDGRDPSARPGRSTPREPRFPWLRRGTTLVTEVGLVLIVIGLASVVGDLPTDADPTPHPARCPSPSAWRSIRTPFSSPIQRTDSSPAIHLPTP